MYACLSDLLGSRRRHPPMYACVYLTTSGYDWKVRAHHSLFDCGFLWRKKVHMLVVTTDQTLMHRISFICLFKGPVSQQITCCSPRERERERSVKGEKERHTYSVLSCLNLKFSNGVFCFIRMRILQIVISLRRKSKLLHSSIVKI